MNFIYLLLFASLLSFGIIIFGDKGLLSLYRSKVKKEVLVQDIAQLRKNNEELRKKIKLILSDENFLEYLIRKKLPLVREEEILVKFQD